MKHKIKTLIVLILFFILFFISFYISYIGINVYEKNKLKKTKLYNVDYNPNIETQYLIKDGISIKVDYISTDEKIFNIIFNIKFDYDISNYEGINISNLIILDDKNNQIIYDIEKENKDSSIANIFGTKNIEKNYNTIRQLITINTNKFSQAETFDINIDKLILYNLNGGQPILKEIPGQWNLSVEL